MAGMFGRRDKKGKGDRKREARAKPDKRGGGGGDLAGMFGLNMEMPDDSELEAELMAMQGVTPGPTKSGQSSKAPMSVDEINKMVAGVESIGEGDDDLSDLDMDDDELLGELQALEEDTPPQPQAKPPPQPQLSPRRPLRSSPPAPAKGGGSVGVVSQRLTVYQDAVRAAEESGESSKARRYKRGVATLEKILKSAKAGQVISEDDLPPEIAVKAPPTNPPVTHSAPPPPVTHRAPPPPIETKPTKPPPKATPPNLIDLDDPEFDEFNFSEEELVSMASSLVDDRQSQPVEPPSKPSPSPRQQETPPTKPTVSPRETKPKPLVSPRQQAPPPAKPAPSPRQPAPSKPSPRQQALPPMKADGMIDLDDPEFDEFNLSEEDMAAMAAAMVDDRKKPKLDDSLSTPSVAMATKEPVQSLPARMPPPPTSNMDTVKRVLSERRDQYLRASKGGQGKEREYRLVAAQFSKVLKALDQGQEVDLRQMPAPPPGYKSSYNIDISKFTPPKPVTPPTSSLAQGQGSSSSLAQGQSPASSLAQGQSPSSSLQSSGDEVSTDIPTPKTTMEALQQRLAKYQEGVRTAQEKGESSRMRRMGRIVKTYEDAIKATKAGKAVDYNDLPTPPGYPPIPLPAAAKPRLQVVPPTQSLPVATAAKPRLPSLNTEQLRLIETRRAELARVAKQEQAKGNKDRAVHWLRLRKGLDTMLEAARSGVPVNVEEIPPSPFADLSQTQPSSAVLSHLRPATDKDSATFDLIEKQLQKQIEICDTNADTYQKMGSTAASLQYQNMSQNCQRELLAIKGIRSQGLGPPKFTLETRKFTIVNSNPEMSSGVCEVDVVRGLSLPKPSGYEEKDMNVYVEVEFPWPTDNPAKDSTETVKDTCEPEFKGQTVKFEIDRKKIKTMTRAFKRTPVKCWVWQKRALRKDLFIGLAQLNIESLETRTEVHGIVDLTEEKGRRPVGGKLEVTARLREPLTGTDKEEREEQWLVFQEAIAAKSGRSMPKPAPPSSTASKTVTNFALLSPVKVESMMSLEALKFEFSLLQSAMKGGHRDKATAQRGKMIQDRTDAIKQKLQTDTSFRQSYSRAVAKEMHTEQQLEAQLAKQGKAKQGEVAILQKRRAAMEKELKALQSRKM